MSSLRIRGEQMDALSGTGETSLSMDLQSKLRQFWPEFCDELGEEGVQEYVQIAMERCAHYEMETRGDRFRYLNLMALLGPDFDTEYDWANQILSKVNMRGSTRIDQLCELAVWITKEEINAERD